MKVNRLRDIMKYITKYITRDIVIVTAILLFVSIVFLVFTRKVIENADNNGTNQSSIQPKSSNKKPNPDQNSNKPDTGLSKESKKHMDNASGKGKTVVTGLNSHLNNQLPV